MEIELILSQSDGRPMYLQIMEQIVAHVATGDMPPGFKLPSIRELAVALKVSVITVKRAYQELEGGGVIKTQQGKGSFISQDVNLDKQLQEQKMDKHLEEAIKIAKALGLNLSDLQARLIEIEMSKQNS